MATTRGGGRDELFAGMYERLYPRTVRFLLRYRVPPDDARDLAQEVFVRFYQRLEQYRGEAEWAFLEKIARNLLVNWWRDRSAQKRTAQLVDIDDPALLRETQIAENPDYAGRLHDARNRKLLYDAIAELSPAQQHCLHLWLDGFKYEEIAEVLRMTLDAVRSRLRDARKALQARLGGHAAALELGRILPEDES